MSDLVFASNMEDAPIRRFLAIILYTALKDQASDLHFEPTADEFRIRYRVNGIPYLMTPPPKHLGPPLIALIKGQAGLNVAETRQPQEGRMQFAHEDQKYDLRVSSLATLHGEAVTIRVLDARRLRLPLAEHCPTEMLPGIQSLLALPHGLILVNGPAGCGKTTLLYAMLAELNRPGKVLFTIEDPVEMAIPRVNQSAIQPAIGLTSGRLLRSILRHDPDVIMIGEIRDRETLQVALQAAATGHLVLAGLNTPDSANALRHLLDFGAEPFLLRSALAGVLSQRLPRQLCATCKRQAPSPAGLPATLQAAFTALGLTQVWEPVGCSKCHNTGFSGRLALQELLRPGPACLAALDRRANVHDLRAALAEDGMPDLQYQGLRHLAVGQTSLGELMRVGIVPPLVGVNLSGPRPGETSEPLPPVPHDPEPDLASAEPEAADDAPIPSLIRLILRAGADRRASDIHFEPSETGFHVRLRIDGVAQEQESPPKYLQDNLISALKLMARLNPAEKRLPQDGRFFLAHEGRKLDLRVATMPTLHGEAVTIRLLDSQAVTPKLERVCGQADTLAAVRELLCLPSGLILANGPTGSGKTTLLYGMLAELNRSDKVIFALEDPVEYVIPGVNHCAIQPAIGLTFGRLLRAVLRHDPDVIMVGEIRDLETLEVAMQAASTGRLVLSTLHTQHGAGAIRRLLDLGVEPHQIRAVLGGVISQRLVRRLCEACKRPAKVPTGLPEVLQAAVREQGVTQVWEAPGCPACADTGYKGRVAIHEVLRPGPACLAALERRASGPELLAATHADGLRPLLLDGFRLVLSGQTSFAELIRACRSPTS